mmetsp:Transcript_19321/g.65667  ORF Transcript_19321/g.65667 Transcript_19321/m.65667 type:complete len:236 (+) Transcript_19321:199-906(+)
MGRCRGRRGVRGWRRARGLPHGAVRAPAGAVRVVRRGRGGRGEGCAGAEGHAGYPLRGVVPGDVAEDRHAGEAAGRHRPHAVPDRHQDVHEREGVAVPGPGGGEGRHGAPLLPDAGDHPPPAPEGGAHPEVGHIDGGPQRQAQRPRRRLHAGRGDGAGGEGHAVDDAAGAAQVRGDTAGGVQADAGQGRGPGRGPEAVRRGGQDAQPADRGAHGGGGARHQAVVHVRRGRRIYPI